MALAVVEQLMAGRGDRPHRRRLCLNELPRQCEAGGDAVVPQHPQHTREALRPHAPSDVNVTTRLVPYPLVSTAARQGGVRGLATGADATPRPTATAVARNTRNTRTRITPTGSLGWMTPGTAAWLPRAA
jgi:hypothetical protein